MNRNFAIAMTLALGMFAGMTQTATAQKGKKSGFSVSKSGFSVQKGKFKVNFHAPKKVHYKNNYHNGGCYPKPSYGGHCPPNYGGGYVVKYCLPHWQYRTFHCYDEAFAFRNYKRSHGYEVYIQQYGGCWRVYYRRCHWRTYRTCNTYSYAQQVYHNLHSQGYQVKIFPK